MDDDYPTHIWFEKVPVRICPHVPPGLVILTSTPPVCQLCLEDAVEEPERIAREAAE